MTTPCTARLGGDGLPCVRDEHDDGSHVYYATQPADTHTDGRPHR